MTAIPKSQAAAARMLERYADLASRVEQIETARSDGIAAANSYADNAAAPMLKEMGQISAAVESWWPHAAPLIANGKKSVQLGGCVIGTRMSRPKLAHAFESDDKAIAALPSRWFKPCTRIRYSLDRTGTLKLLHLGGKAGQDLKAAGFAIEQSECFFVERVQQDRTIGQ